MALTDAQSGGTIECSGESSTPPQITLAGNAVVGDVLGYSSGWKRAHATTGAVIQGRFIALHDGVSGDVIAVSATATVSGRYTGGTLNSYCYVDEGTTYGKVTETQPTTGGDADIIVGFIVKADTVQFFLNRRADNTV